MEVDAGEGHEFDMSAMFDQVNHPARGRRGGLEDAPTTVARDDGSKMRGKSKQFVPHRRKVMMAFPGGAGYGAAAERDPAHVRRDLSLGYITEATAHSIYGLTEAEVAEVMAASQKGEIV